MNGRWIDLTGIRKNLKIKEVENHGATGSVDIVNGMDYYDNLLSQGYNGWSSGTGPIAPGMYLRIPSIGIYIITEIAAVDDILKLTFGDCIQMLRATGADYRRNHYLENQQHINENALGKWENGKAVLTKPANVSIDASRGDVRWAVSKVMTTGNTQPYNCYYRTGIGVGLFTYTPDLDWLYSIKLFSRFQLLRSKLEVIYNGDVVYTRVFDSVTDREITIPLNPPLRLNPYLSLQIRLSELVSAPTGGQDVKHADFETTDLPGGTWDFIDRCTNTFSPSQNFESGSINDVGLHAVYTGSKYEMATSGQQSVVPTSYIINSTQYKPTLEPADCIPIHNGRAQLTYTVTTGGMPMHTVFKRICDAAGCNASITTSQRNVGIFRCGGAPYHSYLLALADMDEPDGRQHGIIASRTTWMSISMGLRRRPDDGPALILYYAGDGSPSSGAVPIKRFNPSRTLRGRPMMAVTKGTAFDGTPIVMCMRDPAVKTGAALSVVDGSVASVTDAALSSYSKIITNRSTAWEGSVELSGIYEGLMTSGTYVGGATVRIYDSRYGMSGYSAKIREVEYDLYNQTTTLTLNNYSEMYSNSVLDTTKMAYSAGDMSVEATSNDMYTCQYVFLETDSYLTSSNPLVYVQAAGVIHINPVQGDVVRVPELGIAVVSAYFPRGNIQESATQQYALRAVTIDGTYISIPEAKRPDKYINQSLIVNIQMRI